MGAVLTLGFLSGLTAAIVCLAQGGGWLSAFALYSGAGALTVLATATLAVLRCRLLQMRAPVGEAARV